ncbi:MAG: WecB/TagA/CpsF family glycosyltransferase [Cyanobacteria bacterium J06639_1]
MESSQFQSPNILGFPVEVVAGAHVADERACFPYVKWLQERLETGQGAHAITFNAEMAMLGRRDREFAETLRQADILVPDGAGVILALKLRGMSARRCPGIELAEALLEVATREQWSVFALGGTPEVLPRALAAWRERYPSLRLDGHHGFLTEASEVEVSDRIQQLQPQLILVGTGVPRQEYWIRDRRHLAPKSIWMGVGGSFDVWSGMKNRAPRVLRQYYLEWLYRLYQEPWRWRRMLALPQFALQVLVRGEKS